MTALAQIWRYPVKSIGRERLSEVFLSKDRPLPFDRHFALSHKRSQIDHKHLAWAPKRNFVNGSKFSTLQAMTSDFDERLGLFTFHHPKLGSQAFYLFEEPDRKNFCQWLKILIDDPEWAPMEVIMADNFAYTDQSKPLISIHNLSSLEDFSKKTGHNLEITRWRGNLWLSGLEAFQEFGLIGQIIRLGETEILVEKRIERCQMPSSNPKHGARDLDLLALLKRHYGHSDFGVFARVIKGGRIAEGMKVSMT